MLSLGTQPLCFRRRELARNIASPGARGRRCTGAARRPRRSRALADDDDEEEIVASATTSPSSSSSLSSRRAALVRAAGLSIAAAAAAVSFSPAFPSSVAAAEATTAAAAAKAEQQAPDSVTARAFLDVALCPSGYRPDRTLGDATALCSDPEPLGRLVLGLYGNAAPGTVEQFLALARAGELDGTLVHKVVRGAYLMGGKQGSRRMGELAPAWSDLLLLPPSPPSSSSSSSSPSSGSSNDPSASSPTKPPPPSNPDLLSPASFGGGPLRPSRPGTLSLALAASDEDDAVRMRPGYRPAEFLITTGPGPVPSLDGGNIAFGRVESGLAEVVGAVSRVKVLGATPGPFGDLARAIGDERVRRVTAKYGRPLQLVVITKAGVL